MKLFDKGVNFKDPETFGEYQLSYRAGDMVSPKIDSYEPLQAEMEDFLKAIQEGHKPRVDGFSGLRVVRVLEAAQTSLESGGEAVHLTWGRPDRIQGPGLKPDSPCILDSAAFPAPPPRGLRGLE